MEPINQGPRRLTLEVKKPFIRGAERVEKEGRLAVVPCQRCQDRGLSCYVGLKVTRCAACIRASKKSAQCAVDRSFLWEVQEESGEAASLDSPEGSDFEDVDMTDSPTNFIPNLPVAGAESVTASIPWIQTSNPTIDEKIDGLNQKMTRRFQQMTRAMDELEESNFELVDIVANLQARVRALEETVANLSRTHSDPSAPSSSRSGSGSGT